MKKTNRQDTYNKKSGNSKNEKAIKDMVKEELAKTIKTVGEKYKVALKELAKR